MQNPLIQKDPPQDPPRRGRERLYSNLRQLVDEIAHLTSRDEVLRSLLNMVGQIFQSDLSIVYLRDNYDDWLYPHTHQSLADGQRVFPIRTKACCARMLEGPFRWPSGDSTPARKGCVLFQQLNELGLTTWFTLPLLAQHQVIGVIVVGYYRYQYLVDDLGRILWQFAQDVAHAFVRHMPGIASVPPQESSIRSPAGEDAWTKRLLSNYHQLTSTLWAVDSLPAMTHSLYQMVQHRIAVMDEYFGILAVWPQDPFWEQALESVRKWVSQSEFDTHNRMNLPVRTDLLEGATYVIAPIQMSSVQLGYLVVCEAKSPLDDLDIIAVQQATVMFAVYFYKQGLHVERRANSFQELLNLLLDRPDEWNDSLTDQAAELGWNVFAKHRLLVATLQAAGQAESSEGGESARIGELYAYVRSRLATDYPNILATRREGAMLFLLPSSVGGDEMRSFQVWLQQVVAQKLSFTHPRAEHPDAEPASRLQFGLSDWVCSPTEYAEAYEQALVASRLAHIVASGGCLAEANQVRVYHMLAPVQRSRAAQQFVSELLDPLLRYDQKHQAALLDTLAAYFETNGSLSDTADRLFIHRTTLQYRLRRIESIIGRSLESAATRFELQLAIILHHLMTANTA